MLLKLKNSGTNPNLTPILANAVGSNPVNNDVLAVIDLGGTSEAGFGLRSVKQPERWRHYWLPVYMTMLTIFESGSQVGVVS